MKRVIEKYGARNPRTAHPVMSSKVPLPRASLHEISWDSNHTQNVWWRAWLPIMSGGYTLSEKLRILPGSVPAKNMVTLTDERSKSSIRKFIPTSILSVPGLRNRNTMIPVLDIERESMFYAYARYWINCHGSIVWKQGSGNLFCVKLRIIIFTWHTVVNLMVNFAETNVCSIFRLDDHGYSRYCYRCRNDRRVCRWLCDVVWFLSPSLVLLTGHRWVISQRISGSPDERGMYLLGKRKMAPRPKSEICTTFCFGVDPAFKMMAHLCEAGGIILRRADADERRYLLVSWSNPLWNIIEFLGGK